MTPLRRALATTATVAALALTTACGSGGDDPGATESTTEPTTDAPTSEAPTAPGPDDDADDDADDGADDDEITMADVEANGTPDSCWAVIDDSVYDLTDWIDDHPGGSGAIEGLCGTDATAQFEAQHGGSSGPENQLAEFEIGELVD